MFCLYNSHSIRSDILQLGAVARQQAETQIVGKLLFSRFFFFLFSIFCTGQTNETHGQDIFDRARLAVVFMPS